MYLASNACYHSYVCVNRRTIFQQVEIKKNYLRSTTQQNRLNFLILLPIERELAKTIDYEEVIDSFAEKKAKKKLL